MPPRSTVADSRRTDVANHQNHEQPGQRRMQPPEAGHPADIHAVSGDHLLVEDFQPLAVTEHQENASDRHQQQAAGFETA